VTTGGTGSRLSPKVGLDSMTQSDDVILFTYDIIGVDWGGSCMIPSTRSRL